MISVKHMRQKFSDGPKLGKDVDFKGLLNLLVGEVQNLLAIRDTYKVGYVCNLLYLFLQERYWKV